jgi:hypothetical protein
MPLKLLLEVLNSTKASAAIKVKVASATLPYTHPRRSKRNATPKNDADRLGFAVDLKKLRNEITRLYTLKKRRNPRPQELKSVQRTSGKNPCETFDARVPLPVAYSAKLAARDKERMEYLSRKYRSRPKLTPNEDAQTRG